ncbi:MAG: hypothetical protein WC127_07505 [Acidaminococcaceae bacterium]
MIDKYGSVGTNSYEFRKSDNKGNIVHTKIEAFLVNIYEFRHEGI